MTLANASSRLRMAPAVRGSPGLVAGSQALSAELREPGCPGDRVQQSQPGVGRCWGWRTRAALRWLLVTMPSLPAWRICPSSKLHTRGLGLPPPAPCSCCSCHQRRSPQRILSLSTRPAPPTARHTPFPNPRMCGSPHRARGGDLEALCWLPPTS